VARDGTVLEVAGQEVKLTNPGRVLYPASGTIKSQVVAYYLGVAPAMLPHLLGRPATRKRWPEGVDGPAFFAKDLEPGTPAWLGRVQVQDNGPKFYPVIDTPAGLAWLGQVSALELHVPQWRFGVPTGPKDADASSPQPGWPDRVVFDFDPGPGAGLRECVEVALLLRDRLGPLGARSVPVSSGSKGLHVYVPMDDPITSKRASEWARLVAEELEKALPDLVVSRMAKSLRTGKVFVDWSQNFASKTTVAPYSLRGQQRPTVAAPRTWPELLERGLRHLELPEVLERLDGGLDPLAGLRATPPVAAAVGALTTTAAAAPGTRSSQPATVVLRSRPVAPAKRAKVPGVALPPGLAGPIAVELARAEERIPGPRAMPGGSRYELKWDGFRACFQLGNGGPAKLWSKNGTDLSGRFPEVTSAAERVVPAGTVLDGELIIWFGEHLAFDLLQRRFAGGPARAREQALEHPASYVVFDLLALAGEDLRDQPLSDRRAALEKLSRTWSPPLQLSPMTDDIDVARRWMIDYRPAGIEGLVVKGAATRYEPNLRRWIKYKLRETTEVLVGAVVGPISRPEAFVAGLYQSDTLRMVGRTVPLRSAQSLALAEVLVPAGPGHPWPESVVANRFGPGRDQVALTRVDPTVVAEISADAAQQGGVWRHPLRFVRVRPDLRPDDLPQLPDA